jgi:hypothetical protein
VEMAYQPSELNTRVHWLYISIDALRTGFYTRPMSSEELAELQNGIEDELTELREEHTLVSEEFPASGDDETIAALERDIAALEYELAAVKAERCDAQDVALPLTLEEQIAALRAENLRLKELRSLEAEIASRLNETKRLMAEVRSLRGRMRRLRRPLRPQVAKKQSGRSSVSRDAIRRLDVPGEDPQELEIVSLEALANRNLIEDCSTDPLEDEVPEPTTQDESGGILKTLSPEQERIIRMRFGIGCEGEHSPEEIGLELSMSPQKVRELEAEALRLLRAPERARHLRILLAAR